MSVYATTFWLGGPAPEGEEAEHRPPILYQGSHVLPTDDDARGGTLDLAMIPGHIEREGRPALADEDHAWPWLRVAVNQEIAVLDRSQVLGLYHSLGNWLQSTRGVL